MLFDHKDYRHIITDKEIQLYFRLEGLKVNIKTNYINDIIEVTYPSCLGYMKKIEIAIPKIIYKLPYDVEFIYKKVNIFIWYFMKLITRKE